MAPVRIRLHHCIVGCGKRPYGVGRNVDLYTGPQVLHTGNTHPATVVRFARHGPHQGGQGKGLPHVWKQDVVI
jgi:hypothetical protein